MAATEAVVFRMLGAKAPRPQVGGGFDVRRGSQKGGTCEKAGEGGEGRGRGKALQKTYLWLQVRLYVSTDLHSQVQSSLIRRVAISCEVCPKEGAHLYRSNEENPTCEGRLAGQTCFYRVLL